MSGVLILVLRLLMAAALYGFLAWAFLTLWRDLRRQNDLLLAHQAPAITLVVPESGQAFIYHRPVVRIGRDLTCDFYLDDKTVSTQHARISFHHSQWWLEDLGSTNGTFLNQEPVNAPVVITQDDRLRIGQVQIDIRIGEQGIGNLPRSLKIDKGK
jgi:pSer/pThr/pTyr-binding forkhead associated (FHA) protein